MIMAYEMAELMGHHIVHKRHWSHDDAPVETELTSVITTSPSLLLIAYQDLRRDHAETWRQDPHALGDSFCSVLLVPTAEFHADYCAPLRYGQPRLHSHFKATSQEAEEHTCLSTWNNL